MNAILTLGLLVLPATSYAYIDPGTGSMAIQAVIAGVAGVSVGARAIWLRLKGMVSSKTDEPSDESASASASAAQPDRPERG